jgi:hypothetical protein
MIASGQTMPSRLATHTDLALRVVHDPFAPCGLCPGVSRRGSRPPTDLPVSPVPRGSCRFSKTRFLPAPQRLAAKSSARNSQAVAAHQLTLRREPSARRENSRIRPNPKYFHLLAPLEDRTAFPSLFRETDRPICYIGGYVHKDSICLLHDTGLRKPIPYPQAPSSQNPLPS